MQRFHGTSPQQLVLVGDRPETAFMFAPMRRPAARLRLAEKDKYVELTLRRRRAQIAARRLLRQA